MIYKDLKVWQKAREVVKEVYIISKELPREELYGLVSQIRRAAVSVPSNIAEGHTRNSTKEYINFISISSGSLAEVETQLILSVDLEFIPENKIETLLIKINELQKMLFALKKALEAKL